MSMSKDDTYTMTVRLPLEQKPTIRNAVFALPPDAEGHRPSMNEWAVATLLHEAETTLAPWATVDRKFAQLRQMGLTGEQARHAMQVCCPRLTAAAERTPHPDGVTMFAPPQQPEGGAPCQATSP